MCSTRSACSVNVLSSQMIMSATKKNEFLVDNEEHSFEDWTIRYKSSHILPSKCTDQCENDELCSFCIYTKELHLPHLPEMVFPNNSLEIVHKSGCCIEFNALDALKLVKEENQSVKIACSESWRKARQDSGLVNKTIGDFDWTFKTNYNGTYKNWNSCELTDLTIDKNKLMQREKILLYRKLILFEDELHDNGTSFCSVRIRVMPSGFFILLRYFLRVDGVIISVNDARIYHEFINNYVIVESSQREGKIRELQIPLAVMNDPDEVTTLIPLIDLKCEKLSLPT